MGLSRVGGHCVMACDTDPVANETYKKNFGINPKGDIKELSAKDIPESDVLCAGFPCQSFSHVGPKGGLKDPRGEVVHEIFRLIKEKQPKAFILENVTGLLSHNRGKTFSYITRQLKSTGYNLYSEVLEAKDYDLPQLRKRLFFVGINKKYDVTFEFPKPLKQKKKLSDIMKGDTEREFAFTIRIGGRRSGINSKFNWDCYMVDGKERYITIKECLALQGFPRNFHLTGKEKDQFRQVGNSVPTNVIREIGRQLLETSIFDNQK